MIFMHAMENYVHILQVFAVNSRGQADVAAFDFTSMFSAYNSSRYVERHGHPLLMATIGDSLHEPFWPMGTGCPRGFLSVFDTAWMIRNYCSGRYAVLEVLAERETIYRLLAQSKPENLNDNSAQYSIDPGSRYRTIVTDRMRLTPSMVANLYASDSVPLENAIDLCRTPHRRHGSIPRDFNTAKTSSLKRSHPRNEVELSFDDQHGLIVWLQQAVSPFRIRVDNLTSSLRSGYVLSALVARYRPDLLDYMSLEATSDPAAKCQQCLDILREEYGIEGPPLPWNPRSPQFRTDAFHFLTAIRHAFKDIRLVNAPVAKRAEPRPPKRRLVLHEVKHNGTSPHDPSSSLAVGNGAADMEPSVPPPKLPRDFHTLSPELALKHREQLLLMIHERRKRQGDAENTPVGVHSSYVTKKSTCVEKIDAKRLAVVEKLINTMTSPRIKEIRDKKPKIISKKWDAQALQDMEEKLSHSPMGAIYHKPMSSQERRMVEARTSYVKEKAKSGFFEGRRELDEFDLKLKEIDRRVSDSQKVGAVTVGALAQQHDLNAQWKLGNGTSGAFLTPSPMSSYGTTPSAPVRAEDNPINSPLSDPRNPPPRICAPVFIKPHARPLELPQERGNPTCHFCGKRTYLAERKELNGVFMHSNCFKCQFCGQLLRVGSYGFDRNIGTAGSFYCSTHLKLPASEKLERMRQLQRKQQVIGGRFPDAEAIRSPPKTPPKPPARPVRPVSMIDRPTVVVSPENGHYGDGERRKDSEMQGRF